MIAFAPRTSPMKPSATVRDLEEQSVIVMEKAYKECTKKWSLDSDGKIYKNEKLH